MDGVIEFAERDVESIEGEDLAVVTPNFDAYRGICVASRSWASVIRDAIDKRSTLVATAIGVSSIAFYGRSLAARSQPLGTSDVVIAGILVLGVVALTAHYCYLNGACYARYSKEDDPP